MVADRSQECSLPVERTSPGYSGFGCWESHHLLVRSFEMTFLIRVFQRLDVFSLLLTWSLLLWDTVLNNGASAETSHLWFIVWSIGFGIKALKINRDPPPLPHIFELGFNFYFFNLHINLYLPVLPKLRCLSATLLESDWDLSTVIPGKLKVVTLWSLISTIIVIVTKP